MQTMNVFILITGLLMILIISKTLPDMKKNQNKHTLTDIIYITKRKKEC